MKDEKHVGNIVIQGKGLLNSLGQKVAQLDQLTVLLKNSLPEPLRQHCQVANFRNDCLVIMTDSAAWATQIRYLIPDLLKQLRRHIELKNIQTIQCYIDPVSPAPTLNHKIKRDPLSPDNINLLASMGKTRDDELGRALTRLAEHAKLNRRLG